jgi:hypothetical protein
MMLLIILITKALWFINDQDYYNWFSTLPRHVFKYLNPYTWCWSIWKDGQESKKKSHLREHTQPN